MISMDRSTNSGRAGKHLQLLRSLSSEVERAMRAIVENNLCDFEESVANQQGLSRELEELAEQFRRPTPAVWPIAAGAVDSDMMRKIRTSSEELNRLNLRYSILLQYSSRSVAQMAALFNSFKENLQEASGSGTHRTWSCRM
jgi:hypothetical protein